MSDVFDLNESNMLIVEIEQKETVAISVGMNAANGVPTVASVIPIRDL
jgi:hypothetical protein